MREVVGVLVIVWGEGHPKGMGFIEGGFCKVWTVIIVTF